MLCFITFQEGGRFHPIHLPDEWTPKRAVSEIKKKTKTFIIYFPRGICYDAILHSVQVSDKRNYHSGWRHNFNPKEHEKDWNAMCSRHNMNEMLGDDPGWFNKETTIHNIKRLKVVRQNNKEKGVVRGVRWWQT